MSMLSEQEMMQDVRDRLTRLEEMGTARDDRMARIEVTLARLAEDVERLSGDIRDAKTGLRIGFAIVGSAGTVIGWLASHVWPFK